MTSLADIPETPTLLLEKAPKRRLLGLDGLRAVAVSSIIVYHDAVAVLPGGFFGVPIFFVLSGYLITRLLIEEITNHGGIQLVSFWVRRIKRLYPELLGMIVVTFVAVLILGRLVKDPTTTLIDLPQIRFDAISSLLYYCNWRFIASGVSYFTMTGGLPSLFKPLWSLAVEEQFYLFWPLIVIGITKLSRLRWRRNGLIITAVLSVASAVEMALIYSSADPSRVWYGTDTNVFWLGIGAFLAFLTTGVEVGPAFKRFVTWAVWPSAALVVVGLFIGGNAQGVPVPILFEGGFFVVGIAVAVVIAFVVFHQRSLLTKGLCWKPVVAIGLASYGAYLYHWGVLLLVDESLTGLSGGALFWLRIAVTAALSAASYFFIKPIVYKKWSRTAKRIGYSLAIVLTVAIIMLGSTASLVYPGKAHAKTINQLGAIAGVGLVPGEVPIPLSSAPSAADPLRVLGFGDSQQVINAPAMSAALQAGTGAQVAFHSVAFPGWGLTTASGLGVANQAKQDGSQIVMGSTVWNSPQILSDNATFLALMVSFVQELKAAGVEGVIFLSTPPTSGIATSSQTSSYPVVNKALPIWANDIKVLANQFPGFVVFFDIGPSYALNGQFSTWLPPTGHPNAPLGEWNRVRATDGIHSCAQGAALYATALQLDVHLEFATSVRTAWQSDTAWQALQASKQAPGVCPADHPSIRPAAAR